MDCNKNDEINFIRFLEIPIFTITNKRILKREEEEKRDCKDFSSFLLLIDLEIHWQYK